MSAGDSAIRLFLLLRETSFFSYVPYRERYGDRFGDVRVRDICGFRGSPGHMRQDLFAALRAAHLTRTVWRTVSATFASRTKRNPAPAPLRYEQFLTSSCALPSLHIDSEPVSSITTEPRSSVVGVDGGLR